MKLDTLDHHELRCAGIFWPVEAVKGARRRTSNGHSTAQSLPITFETRSNGEPGEELPATFATTRANAFELLVGTFTDYLNHPSTELEQQTTIMLKQICDSFGLRCAGLWRKSTEYPDSFELAAHWLPGGMDVPTGLSDVREEFDRRARVESNACCAWLKAEAKKGTRTAICSTAALPEAVAQDKRALEAAGIRSGVIVPLVVLDEVMGAVAFGSAEREEAWTELLVNRLEYLAGAFGQALARQFGEQKRSDLETQLKALEEQLARTEAENNQLKTRLRAEAEYLKADFTVAHSHGEIIGRSQGIRRVLHQVELVAPANCSVLINGETGTGKELIAQQIHRLSARKERRMVLVNCAALPSALVESELFGRERGAYTGALTSQIGRFEMADSSTIFLDEVGELSMEVQAKLLRVLQEGEFQRLGSPKTHKVDVRVIAATNRDLAEDVRKGRFREDLYYRLRVFPIELPPLRERLDDIPLLVVAFMEEFANRMGKKITRISAKAMEKLQAHPWSGNIRELRNVIEHSVILTSGDTLNVTVCGEAPTREPEPVTLAEVERQHILRTLESTSWRIKGPHGAAQRLDVQPSTLYSRMQKLAIPHRRQKEQMSEML